MEGGGEHLFLSTEGHEGPRRKPLQGHYLVCSWRAGGNTSFVHGGPRRTTENTFAGDNLVCSWRDGEGTPFLSTEGHEGPRRKPLQGIIWSVHGGRGGGTPFLSTEGHEGPRRTPLQGHNLVCSWRAGREHLFVHGGPRRTTENTFAGVLFGLFMEGGGEHLFCPRRATKDHGEHLCKGIIWSVHGERGGTPFCPRRATKDHEENLCRVIIWSGRDGMRRTPFVVDSDYGRRSLESIEKRSDFARRRSQGRGGTAGDCGWGIVGDRGLGDGQAGRQLVAVQRIFCVA